MSFTNKINHRQQIARSLPRTIVSLPTQVEGEAVTEEKASEFPYSLSSEAEPFSNSQRQLFSTQQQTDCLTLLSLQATLVWQHRFSIEKPLFIDKIGTK